MAVALDASWMAVAVNTIADEDDSAHRSQIAQHFRLAERLGAETITISGQDVADSILDYARSRNVTKILIGKTDQPRWKRLLFGTVVDNVLENSGEIDVYVIHGEKEPSESAGPPVPPSRRTWKPYLGSAGIIGIGGLVAAALRTLRMADAEANTVMLFLAAVAYVAVRYGRGPSILASGMAVLAFDFFLRTAVSHTRGSRRSVHRDL